MRQRHPDHLDPEQRRVGVLVGRQSGAALELGGRPHAGRATHIDVDVGVILRIGHHRVRVRPAAGLHRDHRPRMPDIGNVENADAARAVLAHRVHHALHAAVGATVRRLGGHEHQVLEHRHVALRAGAYVGGLQRRLGRIGDVEYLVAAVVALDGVLAGEREIGVHEAAVAGGRGVDERLRRRRLGDHGEVPDGFTGVHPAGAQPDPGIRAGRRRAHVRRRRRRRTRPGSGHGRGRRRTGPCGEHSSGQRQGKDGGGFHGGVR